MRLANIWFYTTYTWSSKQLEYLPKTKEIQGKVNINFADFAKGRFPLGENLLAKRSFLLSHELSTGTNDESIQFKQWKVDSRDKIRLVKNGLNWASSWEQNKKKQIL